MVDQRCRETPMTSTIVIALAIAVLLVNAAVIIPLIDRMPKVSMRIITRDNVSVDISAVAYFRVVDAVKSVVAIENAYSAID